MKSIRTATRTSSGKVVLAGKLCAVRQAREVPPEIRSNLFCALVSGHLRQSLDSDDDFRSGCQNVSQCRLKQSFSGLHSPRDRTSLSYSISFSPNNSANSDNQKPQRNALPKKLLQYKSRIQIKESFNVFDVFSLYSASGGTPWAEK